MKVELKDATTVYRLVVWMVAPTEVILVRQLVVTMVEKKAVPLEESLAATESLSRLH